MADNSEQWPDFVLDELPEFVVDEPTRHLQAKLREQGIVALITRYRKPGLDGYYTDGFLAIAVPEDEADQKKAEINAARLESWNAWRQIRKAAGPGDKFQSFRMREPEPADFPHDGRLRFHVVMEVALARARDAALPSEQAPTIQVPAAA